MNFTPELQQHSIFATIADAARLTGYETYVVGGWVRDLLLKRENKKDIDFVCVGSGIELASVAASMLPGAVQVHVYKTFGTAQFNYQGCDYEFVGARKESYNHNSRKPIVEDGTLDDDQKRRDFTINALAVSLNKENYGNLIDPFGGIADLKRKMIKTPLEPNLTFSDDPLRMMRAIRFASQLEFDIHPDTWEGITQNLHRFEILSMERVITEFNKILLSKKPSYGFKLLYHSGLLGKFFPEFIDLLGAANMEGKTHKDNFYHTLEVLDNVSQVSDDLWLRWAAVLHDIAKPATKRFDSKVGWTFHGHEERGARMVKKLFSRFKLPLNEKMRKVERLVRMHLRPIALVNDGVTESAIRRVMFEAGEDLEDLMLLCRADVTTKNPNKAAKYLRNFDLVEIKMREVEAADSLRNFQPVISGLHIMRAFGLNAGPEVGHIKDAVRNGILDGEVLNEFEPAYEYMLKVAAAINRHPLTEFAKAEKFLAAYPPENEAEEN